MSRPIPTSSPVDRARAREVEARLAALGFAPRARGFSLAGEVAGEPWSAARLAAALPGLGPVFAAFGRYLGSRADLLPVADCLVLAAIPDRGEPAAAMPEISERIAAELGAPPLERFLAFEEAPFAVRLFHQAHRAWVAGGDAVVVRIAAPEMEEAIARDAPLLPLLSRALPVGFPLDEAREDFRQALADETDFTLTAEALEEIAREPAERDLPPDAADRLEAPRVERRLTTSRVLTVTALAGTPVPGPAPGGPREEAAAYRLAQRLVRFWLRQALLGRKLPLTADLAITSGGREGRLAVLFGSFAGTHGGAQANLLEYLRAAATDDPEQVFACLVREVVPAPKAMPAVPRGDLRKQLCQVVPLHHEELGAGGAGLAEHLLAHWRVLRQCGYRPELHLESFYRGLLWVTHAARRLAPVGDPLRDPLRDALEELQWDAGWSQVRRLADPRQLGEAFEGYLATLAVLPQQMEQAIALLGRPETPRRERRRSAQGARDSGATSLALGLVMAGLALVVHRLTPLPGLPGGMIERAGALLFLALGTLYLWRAGGRRS